MAAALTSDHVNYLIWRYLQEQGYGKAAIQLSRDWKMPDPQTLAFSQLIQPYALIQMLQDSLAYDQLLVTARQTQSTARGDQDAVEGGAQNVLGPIEKKYKFIDVDVRKRRTSQRPEDGTINHEAEARRKRPRLEPQSSTAQQTPGRRKSSKAAGLSVQTQPPPGPCTGMELDLENTAQQQHQIAEEPVQVKEMPIPEEPPRLVPTLEIGQSTGMQCERIVDRTLVKTAATHIIPNADIFALNGGTKDPTKLTVTGGSAWHTVNVTSVLPATNQELMDTGEGTSDSSSPAELRIASSSQFPSYDSSKAPVYAISQIAHANDSVFAAYALEELWPSNGVATCTITVSTPTEKLELARPISSVLSLRFDPASRYLLAAWNSGCDDKRSYLRVWNMQDLDDEPPLLLAKAMVTDTAWVGKESFMICGDSWLQVFAATVHIDSGADDNEENKETTTFRPAKHIPTTYAWEQIEYDRVTNTLACLTGVDGTIGLLDMDSHDLRTKLNAHDDVPTAMQWQPSSAANFPPSPVRSPTKVTQATTSPNAMDTSDTVPHEPPQSPAEKEHQQQQRILATASADGIIKLWNTSSPDIDCIHECAMEPVGMPVSAIAFSRDGDLLAAVGEDVVLIWRVNESKTLVRGRMGEKGSLVARWIDKAEVEAEDTSAVNDDTLNAAAALPALPHPTTGNDSNDNDGDAQMPDNPTATVTSTTTTATEQAQPNANTTIATTATSTAVETTEPTTSSAAATAVPTANANADIEPSTEDGATAVPPLHCLKWTPGGSADTLRLWHSVGNRIGFVEVAVPAASAAS